MARIEENVVVLLSGGIDSFACANFYQEQGLQIQSLFVDYGQVAAEMERHSARQIAHHLSIQHRELVINDAGKKLSGKIMGRNALILFLALSEFNKENGIVGIGVIKGSQYYDCSSDFVSHMQRVFDGYTNGCVKIGVPFRDWSKLDVWRYFNDRGLPVELTYSCELGVNPPCGCCLSCRDMEALDAGEKF